MSSRDLGSGKGRGQTRPAIFKLSSSLSAQEDTIETDLWSESFRHGKAFKTEDFVFGGFLVARQQFFNLF